MPTARQTPARAVAPLVENIWCWLAGENKSATVAAEVREPSTPVARARPDNAAAPTPSIQVPEESATGPAVRAVGSTRGSPRGASRMSSSHAGASTRARAPGQPCWGPPCASFVRLVTRRSRHRERARGISPPSHATACGAAFVVPCRDRSVSSNLALPPTPSRARATRCRRPTRSTACAGRGGGGVSARRAAITMVAVTRLGARAPWLRGDRSRAARLRTLAAR
jgi:hypothetical protein